MNFQKKLIIKKRTETDTGKLIKKIKVMEEPDLRNSAK